MFMANHTTSQQPRWIRRHSGLVLFSTVAVASIALAMLLKRRKLTTSFIYTVF